MKVSAIPTSSDAWQPSDPSASGAKPVPSLREALHHALVSAWVSAGVVGAFWITLQGSSQKQVLWHLQKLQWVKLELSSSHVKPHSAAWQLPSWPQLCIFPACLPALTSPSNPGFVTYPWHKILCAIPASADADRICWIWAEANAEVHRLVYSLCRKSCTGRA